MATHPHAYVISVLVADRTGILAGITAAVTDLNANIEGISQTVVHGYFTVILIAAFQGPVPPEAIRQAILGHLRPDEGSVLVRAYDPSTHSAAAGARYILSMSGLDRPGILKTLTAYLAEKKINVEDLFFRIAGKHVTHIGEVTVPALLDVKQVQDELRALMAPLGLEVRLQHENLFRAANEVGSIRHMLDP